MKRYIVFALVALGLASAAWAAEISDLNVTDSLNVGRFPESQAPSSLNDGARALEAILARWYADENCSKASTGSANAYVFAANQTLSAYYDGLVLCFDANFANTGAATINVDTLGAKTIKKLNDQDLASGDIEANQKVLLVYDGTNFQMLSVGAVPVPALGVDTAQIAANGVDGTKIAMGSDAQGDVLYYGGTDYARLGAGTSGQFLQTQGAAADPIWADISNVIAQVTGAQDGVGATGTTAIPLDDTTPQNTEGDEFMTLAVTPTNASSTLFIDVVVNGATSGGSGNSPFTVALFQDSTADALATGHAGSGDANIPQNVKFTHKMTAGTTSATTFKVRAGGPNGTFTFNGVSGAQRFNGTMASSITITEVLP